MYKDKTILAIIPARKGSKGIPRKNVRLLCGKPLIVWTIEEALKSKYIDQIIINTDDQEVVKISKKYNLDVLLRPKELATDEAKMIDVILYTIKWLSKNNAYYDIIVLLQPTSPLRIPDDIDNAIELLFNKKKAKAIVSVCPSEHHPYWMNTLPQNRCMKNFLRPEVINKNRQELPVFYRLNGAIYIAYKEYLEKCHGFFGNETYAYVMPVERSIDIDTEIDLLLAETILTHKSNKK